MGLKTKNGLPLMTLGRMKNEISVIEILKHAIEQNDSVNDGARARLTDNIADVMHRAFENMVQAEMLETISWRLLFLLS